jgi:fumarate reductase subunit C
MLCACVCVCVCVSARASGLHHLVLYCYPANVKCVSRLWFQYYVVSLFTGVQYQTAAGKRYIRFTDNTVIFINR